MRNLQSGKSANIEQFYILCFNRLSESQFSPNPNDPFVSLIPSFNVYVKPWEVRLVFSIPSEWPFYQVDLIPSFTVYIKPWVVRTCCLNSIRIRMIQSITLHHALYKTLSDFDWTQLLSIFSISFLSFYSKNLGFCPGETKHIIDTYHTQVKCLRLCPTSGSISCLAREASIYKYLLLLLPKYSLSATTTQNFLPICLLFQSSYDDIKCLVYSSLNNCFSLSQHV